MKAAWLSSATSSTAWTLQTCRTSRARAAGEAPAAERLLFRLAVRIPRGVESFTTFVPNAGGGQIRGGLAEGLGAVILLAFVALGWLWDDCPATRKLASSRPDPISVNTTGATASTSTDPTPVVL